MGRDRMCGRSGRLGGALLVLAAGLAGCPGEEEEPTSAPVRIPYEPSAAALPLPPPLQSLSLSLAATPLVNVGVSFQASQLFTDTGYIPPDTMGAVGPAHIVEMINGNFEVFDKTGASLGSLDLDIFWPVIAGVPVQNGDTFDSRIVFDPASGRFFASSIDRDFGTGNNIYLARSDSSDATGDWDGVRFAADSVAPAQFHDYATLALDADGVYLCTDDFGVVHGKSCYSIPKADLLLAVPSLANLTRFEAIPPGLPIVNGSVQAALDFGPSDGRAALLGATGSELLRGDILGAGAAGATLGSVVSILGDPGHAPWLVARQPYRRRIESIGPRIQSSVVEQGDSLWAVQAVRGSSLNSALRWYEIDEPTNTLLQTGLIENLLEDYIDPSIAVNPFGQVVIGYTCSGPSLPASSCVSAGETLSGVTQFDPPLLLRLGVGYYFQDYGTLRNRWGDYSATVVDPADPCTFWTFQEFVAVSAEGEVGPAPLSGGGLWGTEITQLTFASCGVPVHVVKTVDDEPDGVFDDDPSGWTFDVASGVVQRATTDASGEVSFRAAPGSVSVSESDRPAGDSGLWLVNASCVDDATGLPLPGAAVDQLLGPTLPAVTLAGLELALGDSITCAFQNQRMAGHLTGGGQLRAGPAGRRLSFAGNVGVAIDGTLHGEFQAHFHDVANPSLSGGHLHGALVETVVFGSDDSEEPADPPQVAFDEVHFQVSGELDGLPCQLRVDATDHGEPASGGNAGADADAIRLRLDCPGALLDYDSALDFPEQEAVGLSALHSGNLQILPPE